MKKDNRIWYSIGTLLCPIILLISSCTSCVNEKEKVDISTMDFKEPPRVVWEPEEPKEPVRIDIDSLSFGNAFRWQLRGKGEGATFWWRGNEYLVKLKDE